MTASQSVTIVSPTFRRTRRHAVRTGRHSRGARATPSGKRSPSRTDAQKTHYLPELATGKRRTCIALTEPDTGSDLQGINTRAPRDGDAYVIRGAKFWITNARHADPMPVLVKTDPSATPAHRGMSILLVDAPAEGLSIGRDIGTLGYKGPESCEVVFDDVRVPTDCLLGGVADLATHVQAARLLTW